jgi:hypothetical protein
MARRQKRKGRRALKPGDQKALIARPSVPAKTMWNACDIPICERAKNKSVKMPPALEGEARPGVQSFGPQEAAQPAEAGFCGSLRGRYHAGSCF